MERATGEGGMDTLSAVALAACVVSLIAVWAGAMALWPRLPDPLPVHFDGHGRPDAWQPKSAVLWFGMPAVATGFAALFALILPPSVRRLALSGSRFLSVPRKKEFIALPGEARLRALRPLVALLFGTPAFVNAIFFYMLWGIYDVATGASETVSMIPLICAVAAELAWTAYCILATRRAVAAEAGRAQAVRG
jgi:hypothetical protein